MKPLKKLILCFLLLCALSSAGGCFYFKRKFQPPKNQLRIAGQNRYIPFIWGGDEPDPHASLLVPVTLPGCPKTFYMQFDTGAPYTLFYKGKMEALQRKLGTYPLQRKEGGLYMADIRFRVGDLDVGAKEVKVLDYGNKGINWADPNGVEIIGTLGSDFIDNKVVAIYYGKSIVYLGDQLPSDLPASTVLLDFEFENRRVLLPSKINGKATALLFDTGSSAYELLTDHANWKTLAEPGAPTDTAQVNSWGATLTAYTAPTSSHASFGSTVIPIRRATYVEGMSFMNRTLMRFSGLGGMTGNKLFLGSVLVLDTKDEKFAVVAEPQDQ